MDVIELQILTVALLQSVKEKAGTIPRYLRINVTYILVTIIVHPHPLPTSY